MRKIAGYAYTTWVIIVFSVFMVLLLPFILIPVIISQRLGFITYGTIKVWSFVFSMLTFIRYDVKGRKNIDWTRSYIFTPNHTSFLDAPGISLGIKSQFRPLAKRELKKVPVFGWIVASATVVVDRSSAQSRKDSLERLKSILNQGISILIFPEGTQNRTDQPLQPFYDGAFRASIQSGTPIAPMVIRGAARLMKPGSIMVRPGRIEVIFGHPIDPSSFGSINELKSHCYDKMLELLGEPVSQVR